MRRRHDTRQRLSRRLRSAGVAALLALSALASISVMVATAARPGAELPRCGDGDVQFLGFSDVLNTAPPVDGIPVGELSGLTYDSKRAVYYAIADRAGAVPSHFFVVDIPVQSESLGVPSILDMTTLRDASGDQYNGFNFDGEGVVLTKDGEVIVASEGGSSPAEQPEVRAFSLAGDEIESLQVPTRFLRVSGGGQSPGTNLAFESMALSPNGHSLFTANEAPLLADGRTVPDNRGRIRILRYGDRDGAFAPVEQFYYLTETQPTAPGSDLGVVELIALSETDLLVMERSFVPGQGNTVRVFQISLKQAADVSDETTLAAAGPEPLEKTLLVDLGACPSSGATVPPGATQANPLLDNFEGMALGPKLPGGRQSLLLISDNNLSPTQTTRIVALAVPTSALRGR